jgi:hypothetical protein
MTSLPLFGVNIISNTLFEIVMIVLAFGIGSYSLYHGFRKHHHSLVPLGIFLSGFVFLVLKEFYIHSATWLLIPAVLLIITAHVLNYRSCRVHNHAHREDCNH